LPPILSIFLTIIHLLILLGISVFYFLKKNEKLGQIYFSNFLFITLIGFSVCMGGNAIAELIF
ncbi:MAG: hypothetical protein AAF242_20185, partial [Bacteroidota bacterium]